jgi:3-oxoacyl-[acyl-carrier-protein] synthase II
MTQVRAGVAGVGAVSGYGWGVHPLWDGLKSQLPAGRLHTGLGGRFPDPCWFARVPDGGDPTKGSTRYSRALVHVMNEAIADARTRGWRPGGRVGIVHATTRADLELSRARYTSYESLNPRRAYVESSWTTPSALVMMEHGFTGPTVVASAACSSGAHALMLAHRMLACGDATDMIVTAGDIGFDGEEMRLFASLGPLRYDRAPDDVCRPFQQGSSGFVLGEGAAAVVLTTAPEPDHYALLLAAALGNDNYHPVSIEPSGVNIIATMDIALDSARLPASEVHYYSAHGTGTAECTAADTLALEHIGPQTTAFGFKPLLGHTMGAAPLMDAVVNVLAYEHRFLPAPEPKSVGHRQLAPGPIHHDGGPTVQLGLGFGGNIAFAVWADPDFAG